MELNNNRYRNVLITQNTKIKVATRNNILKKLSDSKCGTNTSTIRTTATQSHDAQVWNDLYNILASELNKVCRAITGHLRQIYVEDLHLLAGIAPPDIRGDVFAIMEKHKHMKQETHSLFVHIPARSFLTSEQKS